MAGDNMYLIRIGYRTVNLEFLIKADDSVLGAPATAAPEEGIRLSVYPGDTFDVTGKDAMDLRLHLDDNIRPLPAPNADAKPSGPRQRATPRGAVKPREVDAPRSSPREE